MTTISDEQLSPEQTEKPLGPLIIRRSIDAFETTMRLGRVTAKRC